MLDTSKRTAFTTEHGLFRDQLRRFLDREFVPHLARWEKQGMVDREFWLACAEAGVLSGGEQQMLTLCRTLMGDPDLIMIDEPTEGLAPKIVELVAEYLRELPRRGVSVLLVEQKLTIALEVSQRCLVMGHGQIVFEGTPAELKGKTAVRTEWLEV